MTGNEFVTLRQEVNAALVRNGARIKSLIEIFCLGNLCESFLNLLKSVNSLVEVGDQVGCPCYGVERASRLFGGGYAATGRVLGARSLGNRRDACATFWFRQIRVICANLFLLG